MHYSVVDCLLDLFQNSVEAESKTITLRIVQTIDKRLACSIHDNGLGMSSDVLERAKDPFYTDGKKHTERKVGLGIPFLIQMVEQVSGSWDITSQVGKGTVVTFELPLDHLDAPPLGNVVSFLIAALTYPGEFELSVYRAIEEKSYELSRKDLLEALGDFSSVGSLQLLSQFVESVETELY